MCISQHQISVSEGSLVLAESVEASVIREASDSDIWEGVRRDNP